MPSHIMRIEIDCKQNDIATKCYGRVNFVGTGIDNQTRMSIPFKSDQCDQRTCMASISKMK